jgi:uncharacterized protein YjdB
VCLPLTSCADGHHPTDATITAYPSAIVLFPTQLTLDGIGESVQIAVRVQDQLGFAVTRAKVEWESRDVAVATVSASGVVTAVGAGEAVITATVVGESLEAEARVVVDTG